MTPSAIEPATFRLVQQCLNQLRQLGRAMAQAVSRRPLTAEVRVHPRSVHVGFMVDKVALGQVFPRVLRFSPPCQFNSTGAPLLGKMKKLIFLFIFITGLHNKP
jgi:hypothetical protein